MNNLLSNLFEKQGAIAGLLCGDAISLWLLIGAYIWKPTYNTNASELPTYKVNCDIADPEQRLANFDELAYNATETMTEKQHFFYVPDG